MDSTPALCSLAFSAGNGDKKTPLQAETLSGARLCKQPRSTEEPMPRVWILLGSKHGDNEQVRALARALGWPFEEKRVAVNRLYSLPNLFLGASLHSLTPDSRAALRPANHASF